MPSSYYRKDGVKITHDPYAPGMAAKYGAPGKTDADGFEPYYAGGGSVPGGGGGYGDLAGSGAGSVDYSRPYGDVAYEPAKPFDDDEPPF